MVKFEECIVDDQVVALEPLEQVADDGQPVDHSRRHGGVLLLSRLTSTSTSNMVSLCFQSTHASPMPPVSPPHKSEITKTPQNIRAQRGTDDATPEGIASRLAGTSTPLPLQSAVAAQSCGVWICVPRFHHCRASCPCTLLPLCGASETQYERRDVKGNDDRIVGSVDIPGTI